MTEIYQDEEPKKIAKKIFEDFELNQSCTIKGFVDNDGDLEAKGKLVCDEIRRLDKQLNIKPYGTGMRRRRVVPENTIGDWIAHKTFKYQKTVLDSVIRYMIWRIQ